MLHECLLHDIIFRQKINSDWMDRDWMGLDRTPQLYTHRSCNWLLVKVKKWEKL